MAEKLFGRAKESPGLSLEELSMRLVGNRDFMDNHDFFPLILLSHHQGRRKELFRGGRFKC